MTSLEKIGPGSIGALGSADPSRDHLAVELTETLKLAVPIALTQLGQIAMMTTDLALIGRLATKPLPRPRWPTRSSSSASLLEWDWCLPWRRLLRKPSA